ncbi:MAG: DUF1289 domain-containing protein [Caulobacteraceae bacterium]|nr:DUF1289 domain-containing protein [Caulobacteraceae bacterium]
MPNNHEKPVTPCNNNCDWNSQLQRCNTCKRTLDELNSWINLTQDQRRTIMKECKRRS